MKYSLTSPGVNYTYDKLLMVFSPFHTLKKYKTTHVIDSQILGIKSTTFLFVWFHLINMKHGNIEIQKNQTNAKDKKEEKQRGKYIQFQSPSTTKSMSNTAPSRTRTKIQISLPPGQHDNSNALPPGQSDRSNPRAMPRLPHSPPPPSAGLTLMGA